MPKINNSLLIATTLLLLAGSALIYQTKFSPKTDDHTHYHAGFIVLIDGVRQDYADFKYMNFIACSEHDKPKSPSEEQIEKAHLHDMVGDVVHVHRPGAKWSDLFRNIGVTLPDNLPLQVISSSKTIADNLDLPITPNESIIIVAGSRGVSMPTPIPLSRIEQVESQSELCDTD